MFLKKFARTVVSTLAGIAGVYSFVADAQTIGVPQLGIDQSGVNRNVYVKNITDGSWQPFVTLNTGTNVITYPGSGGGGSSTLTKGTTATSGYTANQIMISDGSVIQALGIGTGLAIAAGDLTATASAPVLTANTTATYGYSAGQFLYSDGAKIQAATLGNGLNVTGGAFTATATTINGTLPVAHGGTNTTSYTKGDLLVATGATTLAKLNVGADGTSLVADSAQTAGVKWAAASASVLTAGTTATSGYSANQFVYSDGTTIQAATLGNGLNVTGGAFTATATTINGTLPVAHGGTNTTSYTKGDLLVATGATTLAKINVGADGTSLVADSAQTAGVKWAAASASVLTAGTTATSGYSANQFVYSDGAKIQAATLGNGLNITGGAFTATATTINGTLPVAHGGTNTTSYTKGDLLVATGATTLAKLNVGADGTSLVADSAQTAGVKWAAASGSGSPFINASTYGFVCDGVTRTGQATALQNAINAATAGGVVQLPVPTGDCLLDGGVTITVSGVKLRGQGPGSVYGGTNGGTMLSTNVATGDIVTVGDNVHNVEDVEIGWLGFKSSVVRSAGTSAVHLLATYGARVHDLHFLDNFSRLIYVDGGAQSTPAASATGSISGTTLTVSGVSGTIAANQSVIGSGVLDGTTIVSGSGLTWTVNKPQTASSTSMVFEVQAGYANYIDHIHVDGNGGTAVTTGIEVGNPSSTTSYGFVQNLWLDNLELNGSISGDAILVHNVGGLYMSNVTSEDAGNGLRVAPTTGQSVGFSCTTCGFDGSRSNNVLLDTTGGGSISGSSFTGGFINYAGGNNHTDAVGLYLHGAATCTLHDILVTGVSIQLNGAAGVYVDGCVAHANFSNNLVFNNSDNTHGKYPGYFIGDHALDITISGGSSSNDASHSANQVTGISVYTGGNTNVISVNGVNVSGNVTNGFCWTSTASFPNNCSGTPANTFTVDYQLGSSSNGASVIKVSPTGTIGTQNIYLRESGADHILQLDTLSSLLDNNETVSLNGNTKLNLRSNAGGVDIISAGGASININPNGSNCLVVSTSTTTSNCGGFTAASGNITASSGSVSATGGVTTSGGNIQNSNTSGYIGYGSSDFRMYKVGNYNVLQLSTLSSLSHDTTSVSGGATNLSSDNNGNINFSIQGSSSCGIAFTTSGQTSTCGNFSPTSDIRTKTVVGKFTGGLAEVLQVEPFDYVYNGKFGTKKNDTLVKTGVSAQAMKDLLPTSARYVDSEGGPVLVYDNMPLTMALVNAVKTLTARVAELEAGR